MKLQYWEGSSLNSWVENLQLYEIKGKFLKEGAACDRSFLFLDPIYKVLGGGDTSIIVKLARFYFSFF